MAFSDNDRQLLELIHDHQHSMMRILNAMGKGFDALVAAVDNNANATDHLSDSVSALNDEVAQAVDWMKNHAAENNDPALAEMAARLEAKTAKTKEDDAKAVKAKEDLDAATTVVEASGGAATA